jgi:hypothetical protein
MFRLHQCSACQSLNQVGSLTLQVASKGYEVAAVEGIGLPSVASSLLSITCVTAQARHVNPVSCTVCLTTGVGVLGPSSCLYFCLTREQNRVQRRVSLENLTVGLMSKLPSSAESLNQNGLHYS